MAHVTYRKGVTIRTAQFENEKHELEVQMEVPTFEPSDSEILHVQGLVEKHLRLIEDKVREKVKKNTKDSDIDLLM